jgi:xylose isomerase
MNWRYAANAGFFGQRRDRFAVYRSDVPLEERIKRIVTVPGLSGVELKYPTDFGDPARTLGLVESAGLELSAVNVDLKAPDPFRNGSFSSPVESVRARAVSMMREAMDLAAEAACRRVTVCPVMDGHDYAFQKDHRESWDRFILSVGEVAAHREDVDVLLEYQPTDPLAHLMVGTVGSAIAVCLEVGSANLGVNLDVGHAFAAHESPAESAARLARLGLLRYLHSNDNPGDGGDWDMISGSGHLIEWLELLRTLLQNSYSGWISADLSPRFFSAERAFGANVALIEAMTDCVLELCPTSAPLDPESVPSILERFAQFISPRRGAGSGSVTETGHGTSMPG